VNILESRPYRLFYELVRRNKLLNHLAHKVMQSEAVYHVPGYSGLYRKLIEIKAEKYFRVPPFLEITLTDICNSRCIMCPPEVWGGKRLMPRELYEKIVLQAEELGIRKMILTGGEPLVDKRIHEKIRFAKDHGFFYVHMFTNGELLVEKRARELLASGLDSLTISVDSAIPAEYERIRVGLHFDKVSDNIRRFVALRREARLETPIVRVNMVALPENEDSREEFIRVFGEIADIAEIMDSHNWAGGTSAFGSHEYSQQTRFPCHLLFQKVVVDPYGFVKKCSIDNLPSAKLADLNQVPLKEALQSGRLADVKRRMLNYDFTIEVCRDCNHKESWWVDY
jgi:radical SAM protein with 4Fe4S-binding SPASM domain